MTELQAAEMLGLLEVLADQLSLLAGLLVGGFLGLLLNRWVA